VRVNIDMNTPRKGVIQGDDRVRSAFQGPKFPFERATFFMVDRDNDLPIQFSGAKIGYGKVGDDKQGTEVTIYVTAEDHQIIVHVHGWQPEGRKLLKAEVFEDGGDALEWLRKDGRGKLGRASKQAWIAACAAYKPLEHLGRIFVR
jgi:hypothetical protein